LQVVIDDGGITTLDYFIAEGMTVEEIAILVPLTSRLVGSVAVND